MLDMGIMVLHLHGFFFFLLRNSWLVRECVLDLDSSLHNVFVSFLGLSVKVGLVLSGRWFMFPLVWQVHIGSSSRWAETKGGLGTSFVWVVPPQPTFSFRPTLSPNGSTPSQKYKYKYTYIYIYIYKNWNITFIVITFYYHYSLHFSFFNVKSFFYIYTFSNFSPFLTYSSSHYPLL